MLVLRFLSFPDEGRFPALRFPEALLPVLFELPDKPALRRELRLFSIRGRTRLRKVIERREQIIKVIVVAAYHLIYIGHR